MKIISMSVLSLLTIISINSHASTNQATVQSTATLSSTCLIQSQNLSFGTIALPISNQTASSSMNVQCSKNTSYTIALSYGGVYGVGGAPETLNYTHTVDNYDSNYNWISTTYYYGTSSNPDEASQTKTTSTNWTQFPTITVNTGAYGYGMMTGATSGDTIAYSIQVPNNPNEVWNTGNYNYTATGTGLNQSIPVIATLQPSQTASKYPTADTYLDIVTATINY
jgi:spore coat protein U-like protein